LMQWPGYEISDLDKGSSIAEQDKTEDRIIIDVTVTSNTGSTAVNPNHLRACGISSEGAKDTLRKYEMKDTSGNYEVDVSVKTDSKASTGTTQAPGITGRSNKVKYESYETKRPIKEVQGCLSKNGNSKYKNELIRLDANYEDEVNGEHSDISNAYIK
jgi:hypothetical protein